MRKFILLSACLILGGCATETGENTLRVQGDVKGLKKGVLYLQQVVDSTLVTLDSVQMQGSGEFVLEASIEDPDLFYLYLSKADNNNVNDRIIFFAEPGEVRIDTRWNAFDSEAEITGSKTQQLYEEYRNAQSRFNVRQLELSQTISALDSTESVRLDSLQTASERLALRSYLYALNFALNNSDSYLAPFIAVNEVGDASPRYLDSIYRELPAEIAASKYGKLLAELAQKR